MKKALGLGFCVLLCAGAASGQGNFIGLYVDVGTYVQCEYTDIAMALVPVYVVQKNTPGATASQWMIEYGGGFNCTYTGETSPMPTVIGNAFSGISVGYGACLSGDILLLTINFFCQGTSPTCASLEVVPDPAAPTGTIEIVDCSFVKLVGQGGASYFNPDGTCVCYDA